MIKIKQQIILLSIISLQLSLFSETNNNSFHDDADLFIIIHFFIILSVLYFIEERRKKIKNSIRKNRRELVYHQIIELLRKDQNFSHQEFISSVKKIFKEVQETRLTGEIDSLRSKMSESIIEQLNFEKSILQYSKFKKVINSIKIISCEIAAIESSDFFDTIHVEIIYTAYDYYQHNEYAKLKIGKNKEIKTFTEIWSFIRRVNHKTLEASDILLKKCPNCANPLKLNQFIVCSSCNSIINFEEYNWVISEISQEDDWYYIPSTRIPGVEELRTKDPDFCVQYLEEQALLVFWLLRKAIFYTDNRFINKYVTKTILKELESYYETFPEGKHTFYADARVSSVRVKRITINDDKSEFDEAHVLITWYGHEETATRDFELFPAHYRSLYLKDNFIFRRKKNIKTNSKFSMINTRCLKCGAPKGVTPSENCEYCGTLLNDGKSSWILSEIEGTISFNSRVIEKKESVTLDKIEVPSLKSIIATYSLPVNQNKELIKSVVAIMLSDEQIKDYEMKWIKELSLAKGISENKLSIIINSIKNKNISPKIPDDIDTAKVFFRAMVRMSLIDGKVKNSEKKLILKLIAKLGYTEIDLEFLLKKEKKLLVEELKSYAKNKTQVNSGE